VFGDESASFTLVTRERDREGAHSAKAAPRVGDDVGMEATQKAPAEPVADSVEEKRRKEAKVLEAMDTGNPLGRKQLGKATMKWLSTGAAEVGSYEDLSDSQDRARGYGCFSGHLTRRKKDRRQRLSDVMH
jgi:hypothetical protein